MSANVPKNLVADLNGWYLAKEDGVAEWDSRMLSTSARAAAIAYATELADMEDFVAGDVALVVVKDARSGEETTWGVEYVLAPEVTLRNARVSG